MSDPAVAEDVLVFRWEPNVFRLIGGRGRGAGWANIVDVDHTESPAMQRAWRSGATVRVTADAKVNVAGPYWAADAVIVPVGHQHVVVFGGDSVAASPDAAFITAAARAVADTGDASAEKLLSDELELVHAVRAMTTYQASNVRDTARHIATVAARALSCDVAAVRVRTPSETTLDVLQFGNDSVRSDPAHVGRDAEIFLDAASTEGNPIVEQTVGPDPEVWTDRVVSRMTLPIGSQSGLAALSLGHSEGHERGFTSLCQRIGRALAESAEPLLNQAIALEKLATEREHYQRATRVDSLTGVGNRTAWDMATASPPPLAAGVSRSRRSLPTTYAVLSADVDHLKQTNDAHGHVAGDAVLRSSANLLRNSLRPTDVLCRVGGDEFLALLPNVDDRGAKRIVRRIGAVMDTWRPTEQGVAPALSLGWAIYDGDWDAAVCLADRRMYDDKRKRESARTSTATAPVRAAHPTRRRADAVAAGQSRTE
jgi:diguanylate cyclase (GGDEF)-like protein